MLLLLAIIFTPVALPVLVVWACHVIIGLQAEKEATSFSGVYAAMQREIKLKEINKQALAFASQKKLQWQQDRAYIEEYRRLFLASGL